MYCRLFIVIAITLFSCQKILDINDFADDFGAYEPELRIEALMLPTDNTAIIRIDRSTRLDEGINDEGYYNCIDDDDDWNYYYCPTQDISYENKSQCIEHCNTVPCFLHYYSCETDNKTFVDKSDCENHCSEGKCVTDDVGSDGNAFDEVNIFGESIGKDEDGSEGDGQPNCGEPKVDEFDEVLPEIHVDNCLVFITQGENTCFFEYHEDGGQFYDTPKDAGILDVELVTYGAWRPNASCEDSFNFAYYDSLYTFGCNCSQAGFSDFGLITALDTLKRPPVFYDAVIYSSIIECAYLTEKEQVYNCLKTNEISDTLTFVDLRKYACYQDGQTQNYYYNINSCIQECTEGECICSEKKITNDSLIQFIADTLEINVDQIYNSQFNYATLSESNKYQLVQYMYDERIPDWVYFHGHPAFVPNQDAIINDNVCLLPELVVAEQYRNDCIVEASFFKYDVFTFSRGYENYYFYDQLDLADPVRSNLRNQNGNPVMGAFGSMARNSIYFEIISTDSLLRQ